MPRCLPRPTTETFVTAGNPASISAASTLSTLSGRTIDLIIIMANLSLFSGQPLSGQPVFDKKLFKHVRMHRFGDDLHCVCFDLACEGPVFLGLGMLRIEFDHGLAVDFRSLDHVVPRHEMDHLSSQLLCERFDHFTLVINFPAVADKPAKPDTTCFCEFDDTFADVVRSVHGHHLARNHDVDLLGLSLADGHGEAAANDVAQDVVEHVVERIAVGVSPELLQQVDGSDNSPACAAHARFRTAGFYADGLTETDFSDVVEFDVL